MMRALDLFSAAAGGWSLGLHRAGFVTVAACEIIEWRRALYAENNPHVRLYEDVRTLTAARLVSDLGFLPDIIVGSPPCQDISSANTQGKGVEGERSGLYLEAVRLVGDCRPRWFAFENSSNLRTRGADRLLAALETLGYACEPCVVGADNVGANHIRKRSWLIGYDPGQLADAGIAIAAGWHPPGGRIGGQKSHEGIWALRPLPRTEIADSDGDGRDDGWRGRRSGIYLPAADDPGDATPDGRGSRWPRRRVESASGPCEPSRGNDADAGEAERRQGVDARRNCDGPANERREGADRYAQPATPCGQAADRDPLRLAVLRGTPGDQAPVAGDVAAPRDAADTNEARRPDGRLEPGLRSPEIAHDGRGDGRSNDRSSAGQMGGRTSAGGDVAEPWADWNGGLAHHLLLDDGLSAWVAGTRVAIGDGKRTSAASLIVEAFGDAVLPQIPEAIGRAILRTEAALDAVLGRAPGEKPGDER